MCVCVCVCACACGPLNHTLTTGGGVGKSCLFSVKSSTRKVAEDMTNLSGLPIWGREEETEGRGTNGYRNAVYSTNTYTSQDPISHISQFGPGQMFNKLMPTYIHVHMYIWTYVRMYADLCTTQQ